MQKSLSHYTCAAKSLSGDVGGGNDVIADSHNHKKTMEITHFQKSWIDNTHFVEQLKSLSHYTCAANSLFSANTNAKRPIGAKRKCL